MKTHHRTKHQHHRLVVTVDGERHDTTLASLAAQYDLDAKARAKIAALVPDEHVEMKGDDGKIYKIARLASRLHRHWHEHGGHKRHRGSPSKRHRTLHHFATPHEHGAAVAELEREYRDAQRQYHRLGESLFEAKGG
jgi:hypothetical protein